MNSVVKRDEVGGRGSQAGFDAYGSVDKDFVGLCRTL